jgi:hypothetical protein
LDRPREKIWKEVGLTEISEHIYRQSSEVTKGHMIMYIIGRIKRRTKVDLLNMQHEGVSSGSSVGLPLFYQHMDPF